MARWQLPICAGQYRAARRPIMAGDKSNRTCGFLVGRRGAVLPLLGIVKLTFKAALTAPGTARWACAEPCAADLGADASGTRLPAGGTGLGRLAAAVVAVSLQGRFWAAVSM
ncbi:hypothetical protein HJFPF1_12086 [Paramyrothecium foliicola]|nr:hypothetical protein HJFPF1_12086 [Paramyrothecium foliicola]